MVDIKKPENETKRLGRLTHIDLEISRKCNLKCVHCSAADKKRGKEMSVKVVKKILLEAKPKGLEKVGLTGGEPFLNKPKLLQVAGFCRDLNIPIHIHSNGTLITEQDAKWIKKMDAEITIALYGHTAQVHESITGKEGSFSLTITGLKNLIGANTKVCVYIVPMKQNLHSISRLIELVSELGVKQVRVLSLSPTGKAKAQFENLELTDEDAKILNNELLNSQQKTKIGISTGFCTSQVFSGLEIMKGHEQCFAAENRIHIDTFGNVFPCTASSGRIIFSAGNLQLQENNLNSVWTGSPLLQFFRDFHRRPPRKCSACNRHKTCMSGCRIRMSYEYGDVSIPDPKCGGPYN